MQSRCSTLLLLLFFLILYLLILILLLLRGIRSKDLVDGAELLV